ncbi:AMP-binding protein [Salinirubellus salinus]|uniref:AMP-binding protein n=1 Tax=Salinirubellus salinus TaxID=1364945 RepID=A0A9E7R5L6_9EURY|nr:AMP-binding protein [Salinirubellus salinus]UWM56037.1 AMP-binding protein [Salinirubellus salinus]
MVDTPRLVTYHFYEREWDSYDELLDWFEWEVPDRFNAAAYCCDRWADETPDAVAIRSEDEAGSDEALTYAELDGRARRLAGFLREQGVSRGDRVGVNCPQRPETVLAHLACWKLGATSVPLSTLFGPDGLEYRLADAGAVACVVDASNVANYREAREGVDGLDTTVVVGGDTEGEEVSFADALEAADGDVATVDTLAEDESILIYTSGTTGDPKGVRHAHRLILGNLPLFLTSFCNVDLRDDDVFWTPAEWAWVASLFDVVFPSLYYGRELVASRSPGKFDPERAFEVVERHGVTRYFAPPTALRMMMQVEGEYGVSSVRTVASGGESLGQSIVDWAADVFDGAAVHEGYGQTEANMLVGDCTALTPFVEGYIGRRAPGHEVDIVDPETAEATVPIGETGEIAVRYEGNPVCFLEYWNEPEKTDRKVRDGWLLTEDLGRVNEDGYLTFVGRTDDVIISSGYRIGPEEVEDSVATHEAAADAAVIGVPDDERGQIPKAFVVLGVGHEPSDALTESIQQHVRDRLAKYEYPRAVEYVDELPKTTTGKVRRASLRDREGLD